MTPAARRGFETVETWIFDLDNTLYPAECNLFAQVDRRMGEFIADLLGVPYEQARHLQKTYYRQFGTTLSGLMQVHKIDPRAFLDYVHDLDLSVVPEHPELAAELRRLPGRKLIFTNGSRGHAERVAAKLGVLDCSRTFATSPPAATRRSRSRPAYATFLKAHGVEPQRAAMFEDMPHNLLEPHVLGMTTVLVHSSYYDHPIQLEIRKWTEPPEHIHHMTEKLAEFLGAIEVGRM